jgi:hypothetical protein
VGKMGTHNTLQNSQTRAREKQTKREELSLSLSKTFDREVVLRVEDVVVVEEKEQQR